MHTHLLIRVGEIFLKGKNKNLFENKLVDNLKKITGKPVKKLRSRYVLEYFVNHCIIKNVFGLTSYSPALKVEKDIEKIKEAALKLVKKGTFKVETKRSDKSFPIKSLEINRIVGKYVEDNSPAEFRMKQPQLILSIEINQDLAYLFTERISCFGGLPTGVEGRVLLLVEDSASLLAGLLFMKRGSSIYPVSFSKKDISFLQNFNPEKLNLIIIKDFFELERFSEKKKINLLVSGQTFKTYEQYGVGLTTFRPLIAYDQKEIKGLLSTFNFQ